MKHLITYLQNVDRAWLTTWIVIYLGFVTLDAFFPGFFGITVLKMTGIILCVVYAHQKFPKDPLLALALGFTLLADTILALDNVSLAGVFVFCIAQFFHTTRLRKTRPATLLVYIAIINVIFFITIALQIEPMYALGGIYAYGLFSNLYLATRWYFSEKSIASTCAFTGFLLFVACDFCVALSYLSGTGVIPAFIQPFANYFAWVFYYPSQVLISGSSDSRQKVAPRTKSVLQ